MVKGNMEVKLKVGAVFRRRKIEIPARAGGFDRLSRMFCYFDQVSTQPGGDQTELELSIVYTRHDGARFHIPEKNDHRVSRCWSPPTPSRRIQWRLSNAPNTPLQQIDWKKRKLKIFRADVQACGKKRSGFSEDGKRLR